MIKLNFKMVTANSKQTLDETKQIQNTNVSKLINLNECSADKRTIKFAELPQWLRDNHYLHNNHRAPTESYLMCIKSCFSLHTETINIW